MTSRTALMAALLAALLAVGQAGCSGTPAPPPDYSKKPGPGVDAPYVPKNHNTVMEKPNKGPVKTDPRLRGGEQ
jgi:hypothetical protein